MRRDVDVSMAALLLGMDESTVRRKIRAHVIPAVMIAGKYWIKVNKLRNLWINGLGVERKGRMAVNAKQAHAEFLRLVEALARHDADDIRGTQERITLLAISILCTTGLSTRRYRSSIMGVIEESGGNSMFNCLQVVKRFFR